MIYLLAVPAAPAILILAAAWLDRPKGRHRLDGEKAAGWFRSLRETPAPGHGPVQAPGPADPPRPNGAVRARATLPGPGAASLAPEEATITAPDVTWPGAAPDPGSPPSTGPGRYPFSAPVTVAFPDGRAAILDEHGAWHVRELAWDGRRARETGAQPALPRGHYDAFDAWRDMAVNQ